MKSTKNLLLVAGLFLVTLLSYAGAARACTQDCVFTSGVCQRCKDTGHFTGATCRNSGSCACVYTQNNCSGVARSTVPLQPDLAAVVAPAGQGAACSASEKALPNSLVR